MRRSPSHIQHPRGYAHCSMLIYLTVHHCPSHHRDRYPEHLSSVRLERSYDTPEGRPMDMMHTLCDESYHVFNVFHLSVNFLCLVLLQVSISMDKAAAAKVCITNKRVCGGAGVGVGVGTGWGRWGGGGGGGLTSKAE
jgi:hypothetical protein